jgi:secreted trypsin-like serine protease
MSHRFLPLVSLGALSCAMLAGCSDNAPTPPQPPAPATVASVAPPPAVSPAPAESCEVRRERADNSGGRIVGGEPARPGSAPWQVEILSSPSYDEADRAYDLSLADGDACKIYLAQRASYELAHKCGGAYIGDRWVATAAHCLDNIPGFDGREGNVLADRRLRLGTQNLTIEDGLFAIESVVIHAGYSKASKLDDIALARVAEDPRIAAFEASGRLAAVPVMAPGDRDFDPGEALRVTGWGWMGQRNERDVVSRLDSAKQLQRNPADLQQLTLNYLPDAQCAAEYGAFYGPGALCAGTLAADGSIEFGKDSCQGDSGGPLTREEDGGARSLVGVVSGGKGCGAGKPAVYTRVSYYGDWIAAAKAAAKSGEVVREPQPGDASGSR